MNLTNIVSEEAFDEIVKNRQRVELDKKLLEEEEKSLGVMDAKPKGIDGKEGEGADGKQQNPMSEMAKALKAARAAKLEA